MARTKEFEPEKALESAMDLFWLQGYEATSVQDLLDCMRIGRGSLYDTFGDKRALFLAALDRYEEARFSSMAAALDAPGSARKAVAEVVERTVKTLAGDERRRGCLIANSAVELAPQDAEVGRRISSHLQRTEDALHRALIRAHVEGPGRRLKEQAEAARAHPKVAAGYVRLVEGLCDLGEGRVAAMDEAGVDVQVLSLTSPGMEQLGAREAVSLARGVNDTLAEAVRRYPGRFAGFAALPTAAPEAAAEELERAVGEHGFVGALVNGHAGGRYLDDSFFWPILGRAEALGVPIYLHPTPPPQPVVEASYAGNFAPGAAAGLATAAWGWHVETATHVLRLVLGGAFDRYPGLQLVVGHLGEGLPFFLPRLELALPREVTGLERSVGDYLRENVHYTFGGFNWTQAFLDLLFQVGVERIMFSTDHPYASMAEARAFLDRLPVSPADRERMAHGNAERLLGL